MTPCEKLGYKAGDEFEFIGDSHFHFKKGDVATLEYDDGSGCPPFYYKNGEPYCCVMLDKVTPLHKPITLRPGDYVSTKGMSEADYHAVAEAFIEAGAKDTSSSGMCNKVLAGEVKYLGWDINDKQFFHSQSEEAKNGSFSRHLTIAQVLGTTKQHEEKPTTAFDTLIVAARKRNEAREALQEAESEFQSALSAANAELGEGFEIRERDETIERAVREWAARISKRGLGYGESEPHPCEDMNDPANWREGDVLECVKPAVDLTMGGMYTLEIDPNDGELSFRDDAGDWRDTPSPSGSVKFHHRPA